ncbi:TPA: hypothetical protein UOA81_001279 [Stenotrophomonas maltophilia]|jgi:hypothetical protein|uniref:hypothetical protein n=1 Tax=Stenotrophomonas maltophilia TaxID=40324 RepID=UPI000F772DA2|nr:hypothetical protein [Stenotrophomonas maltophilia]RRU70984.1 hypothetical protein EGJ24_20590 [Stenotrophomonas maltophilia]HEL5026103.1 hypothetical protein [Stenotrophomonas maltophilia]
MEGFAATFWQWHGAGDGARVEAACTLLSALDFLQQDALGQAAKLPQCLACEVQSSVLMPLVAVMDGLADEVPPLGQQALLRLRESCAELDATSLSCSDDGIFEHAQWQAIRMDARQAGLYLALQELLPYLDELRDAQRSAPGR